MAVPKRKTSKARRDKRRSPNMKMKAPGLSICPQCHEPKLPHRVCPNCNYYDGKDVMESQDRAGTQNLNEFELHLRAVLGLPSPASSRSGSVQVPLSFSDSESGTSSISWHGRSDERRRHLSAHLRQAVYPRQPSHGSRTLLCTAELRSGCVA